MSTSVPPRAARLLLRLLPTRTRRHVRADLDEEFQTVASDRGLARARRWYWKYTLRSIVDSYRPSWRPCGVRRTAVTTSTIDWAADARQGFRLLRREPVVSAALISTMILGIGAVSAVASLVWGIMIRPLPFPDSADIVQLSRTDGYRASSFRVVGLPDLLDWRARSRTLQEVAGWTTTGGTLIAGDEATRLSLAEVTEGFEAVLGIEPSIGRFFVPSDFTPEAGRVLVLSHGLWRERLGADPDVLGRRLTVDNESYAVVGVLPEMELEYPEAGLDGWVPLVRAPSHWSLRVRGASWLNAVARVRPDVTLENARSEMETLQRALVDEYPRSQEGQTSVRLEPLKDVLVAPATRTLRILSAAVAGILVLACLNVAMLILARATRRSRELSIRAALGGSSARIRRQLLAESSAVAFVGGALGLVAAPVALEALVRLHPSGLPRSQELGVDWSIVLLAVAGVAITAVVSSYVPAVWNARAVGTNPACSGGADRGGRARTTLAVLQISISVVMLIASVLLLQTLHNLTTVDPGFDGAGVTAFHVTPSAARYPDPRLLDQFYTELLDELRSNAAIERAGLANFAPFTSGEWGHGFTVWGGRDPSGAPDHPANVRITRPGYYSALGIPLVTGRLLDERDAAASAPVALLNDAAAADAFPGSDPVGEFVFFDGEVRQVVGVVGNVRHHSLYEATAPEVHLPARQAPPSGAWIVVRARAGNGGPITEAIRRAVRAVDPTVAPVDIASYDVRMSEALAAERFRALLASVIGALAVVIALVGVYGTLSNMVARTVREIGIRMALGQARAASLARVLRKAGLIAFVGVSTGVAIARSVAHGMDDLVYGIGTGDLRTYALVASAVWLVSVLAAMEPALRASRLDPVSVMRSD